MAIAPDSFEVLLFDLGRVLVELTGVPVLLNWLNHSLTEEELWQFWLASPAVRRYESGVTTADEFGVSIVDELGLSVSPSQFLEAFARWPRGWYPGVVPLLQSLRPRYRLACFSNSNALHWARLRGEMGLDQLFESSFASHLIGRLKPDKEAFQYVLGALGCAPDRILFLDDSRLNVDAALAAGMQAYVTRGFSEVRATLAELGLTPPHRQ